MNSCDEADSNYVEDTFAATIKQENTSGYCCCCLFETDLKSLCSIYHYEGKPEVYSEMLLYCFSIKLLPANEVDIETYKICEACVYRLREACYFKKQIETTQASLEKLSDFENSTKEQFESDGDIEILKTEIPFHYSPEGGNSDEEILKEHNPQNYLSNKDSTISKTQKKIKNKKFTNNVSSKRNERKQYVLSKDEKTCKICNKSFPLHNCLVRHMPIHFPNHICDICAKVFTNITNFKQHIARHKQTPIACELCHKVYKGREYLKVHMRTHNDPSATAYSCPHCPERFSAYHRRIRHLVEVHNDEPRKYECDHCDKRFPRATDRLTHIKRVHLQEKSCICSECGSAFFNKKGLKEHMVMHTGVKNFQCDICQKTFGRRFTLGQHMRTHTNDKQFTCTDCGRSFTQKCTLKDHLKTHRK